MGDFDAARAERQRQRDHVFQPVDIGAMDDGVDRQRNFQAHDFLRQRAFAGKGAGVTGDVVGARGVAVLNGDLDVVEAGGGELFKVAAVMPTAEVIRLV